MIALALGLGAAVALCGVLAAIAAARRARELAALRAPAQPPPEGTLSIIVPARNEAHNLPALLASLAALDPPAHQLIVVDDHSSDGTGELARAAGATVVVPEPLPPGWVGKSWACRAGAQVATGTWLLFTDADTAHAPWSAHSAIAAARAQDAALLSVVPTHALVRAWEHLQGVFFALLLLACRAGAPAAATGAGERRFSIGQYLLFRADAYRAFGGHEAVRDRLAEDLALARVTIEHGGRFGLLLAPGLVTVRMYPEGFGAFMRGWRRSFREGMRASGADGAAELVGVIGWLLGVPLLAGLAGVSALGVGPALPPSAHLGAAIVLGGAYLGTAAVAWRASAVLGPFRAAAALAYPVTAAIFAAVSALAAWDHVRGAPVAWRGRHIRVPRGAP